MIIWKAYTDGACSGNPGTGGWGVHAVLGDDVTEWFGGEKETTNNRMELMAVIMALRHIPAGDVTDVISDSQYVVKGMTEWIPNWKRNGWRAASGRPVTNQDLWQELDKLCDGRNVRWQWVRGHDGNIGNERADELARKGITMT